jgi:PAS domain S-box-containing protein
LIQEHGQTRRALAITDALKDYSLEGAVVLTPDLDIESLNPAAETVLGYASQEVRGQAFGNVLIGADNLVPALQSALQGVPTHNLGNVRLHRRDGSVFLAHLRTLPVHVAGQLEAVLVLLRDLSEREQFEVLNEQLEQRAMLGEVSAIFAHEVRNPINNISTGLQLMYYNLPEDDPYHEVLARLLQDCNRLTHLMESILAFSRPPENKLEPVDLNTMLPALVDRWRPRLVRTKVQQKIKSTAQQATVFADLHALEQVFNNLIGNAVEAMRETGGNLTIHIRQVANTGDRPRVEISISDDGPGIPEEIIERIFEPFFTTNRNGNGTGLGLAIAKRIVTKHKGTIKVSSVPGGTVFQVILPMFDGVEAHES